MNATEVRTARVPTIRRLPSYLLLLRQLRGQGRQSVSSTAIADELALDRTQVRKDLAVTGIVGKPKVGYEVTNLIEAIESFLSWNDLADAVLVGTGNLGSALLGYRGLAREGFNIAAAFDVDPAKIGTTIHKRQVLPLAELAAFAATNGILIGILTVPAEAAQGVANLLVRSHIRAIWNFTPVKLDVPPHVVVENVELLSSLAVLSSRLAQSLRSAHRTM